MGASVSPPHRDVAKACPTAPDRKHELPIQLDRELALQGSGGLSAFREAPRWVGKVSWCGVRGPLAITQPSNLPLVPHPPPPFHSALPDRKVCGRFLTHFPRKSETVHVPWGLGPRTQFHRKGTKYKERKPALSLYIWDCRSVEYY